MIRGLVTILLLFGNLILIGTPVAVMGIVKFAIQLTAPRSRLRTRVIIAVASLAERWVGINDRIFDLMLPTRWEIAVDESLKRDGHYLIISNHLSWVDIFAVQRAFHGRLSFLRFFLKRELIWFPILGQACWALEFPFMNRYSREYLAQHPEKRGKDLATTQKACQRYRHMPVAILNFAEGTRFTADKRDDEDSPYRQLLRPRVGGVAFVLASLGDQLDGVLDVTLSYPREPTVWRFVTGQLPVIRVRARRLDVPAEFFTAEITEPGAARDRFKSWIESVWREKDALLEELGSNAA